MSEIPDWLVELAAQQGEESDADAESEWDFLRAEPAVDTSASSAAEATFREPALLAEVPVLAADASSGDLVADLRSQVEDEEPEEEWASRPAKSMLDFRLAGLLPWQQLVLAVLLFFDISIIGLLFLVMLGRIAIP
jgi:hypothetical protein